jgi:hypothetical protein
MLLVPFVDSGELQNDFINEESFVEEGELGDMSWAFPKFVVM